ncbi:ORF6C domain-containing protein [Cytobacillus horneckiae]|uniref:ORF6C domain-containing protein n=1 Tax=Cytobacillus horneckiae TaxID=549687 RepID=UPI003D1AEBBE
MSGSLLAGEQRRILNCISQRVYGLNKTSQLDTSKLYKGIHHDLKVRFNVSSYKYIERNQLLTVIKYVETWKPL